MSKIHATRGYGLLEGLLARQGVKVANRPFNFVRLGEDVSSWLRNIPLLLINTIFHEKFSIDKVVREEYREQASMLKISLLEFDIEQVDKMPFKDNYFDAVSMLAVFEHLEPSRLEHILKEIIEF